MNQGWAKDARGILHFVDFDTPVKGCGRWMVVCGQVELEKQPFTEVGEKCSYCIHIADMGVPPYNVILARKNAEH